MPAAFASHAARQMLLLQLFCVCEGIIKSMDVFQDDMFLDPISCEVLNMPVLASDGYTYNVSTLQQVVAADVWRRSPITMEVLRPWAYPNAIVSHRLGCPVVENPVLLFPESCGTVIPKDGRLAVLGLPPELSCEEDIIRHSLYLPREPVLLTVILRRDGPSRQDVLMHPPCADSMRDRTLALAQLFGVNKLVNNPWCLTTAVLDVNGSVSVEDWLLQH